MRPSRGTRRGRGRREGGGSSAGAGVRGASPVDRAGALVAAFADAYRVADRTRLALLLAPDVRVVVDSGGIAGRAHGAAIGVTAALTLLTVTLGAPDGLLLEAASVNGRPGLRASRAGRVVAVIAVDGGTSVDRVWLVTNPAKLRHWS
jgi:RNA polymerase sigma-70 factor (ECF subfamily)